MSVVRLISDYGFRSQTGNFDQQVDQRADQLIGLLTVLLTTRQPRARPDARGKPARMLWPPPRP